MAHAADQIRDALASRLSGLTLTQDRVFKGRTQPFEQDEMPCLNVRHQGDVEVPEESDPRHYKTSDLLVSIEVRATTTQAGDLDGALLDVRAEVETQLEADIELQDTLLFLVVEEWETELEDADKRIGLGRLLVRCRYQRQIGAPEVLLT